LIPFELPTKRTDGRKGIIAALIHVTTLSPDWAGQVIPDALEALMTGVFGCIINEGIEQEALNQHK